jgi:chromatin segregation and condensation protein Rec8/ScpA/Scc1 (kleisin family)
MYEETSTHLNITVTNYDGPFDVLISLIRRNEWSIDDLPVLEITRQFLEYIRSAKDIDTELGGQFIETASWLVLLKSRSLLPSETVDGLTPKDELRRALIDKETLASAAGFLRDRASGPPHPASAGAGAGHRDPILPPEDVGLSLKDVLDAALEAVAAARAAASFRSTDVHNITVEDQLHWIATKVSTLPMLTAVSTVPWFEAQPTPVARIALLLAMLELARQGFILLYQAGEFAAILIKSLREIPADLRPVDESEGLPLILT